MRKELAGLRSTYDRLRAKQADLKKELADAEKIVRRCTCGTAGNSMPDLHESTNMPSSSMSLYNAGRKAFRESRG